MEERGESWERAGMKLKAGPKWPQCLGRQEGGERTSRQRVPALPSAGTSGEKGAFLPQGEDMSLGLSAGKMA